MIEENLPSELGWLPRDNAKIYWESSGNPDGVPVLTKNPKLASQSLVTNNCQAIVW